jgi:hypothetical protein
VVHAYAFSSTVALNLLARAGVRDVRSLGVDGGKSYSNDFQDLAKKTLLAAGQNSYDLQFQGVADTISSGRITFVPLDIGAPIRIFIDGARDEPLAARVLADSIRRRASISVEMVESEAHAQVTVGARSLVRGDIRDLQGLIRERSPVAHRLDESSWPALVELDRAASPWKVANAPLVEEWCTELLAGIERGAIHRSDVVAEVESGGVRGSLLAQIERRLPDPLCLPPELLATEGPTRRIGRRWLAARARYVWQRSRVKIMADKFRLRDWSDPVDVADFFVKLKLRLGKRGWRGDGREQGRKL